MWILWHVGCITFWCQRGCFAVWFDRYLQQAVDVGASKLDGRHFYVGAVGLRSDGAAVSAMNGRTYSPNPFAHAERRLLRKLDKGSVVFVGRSTRDGTWALARPCMYCRKAMRGRVTLVVYTIAPGEYGVMR